MTNNLNSASASFAKLGSNSFFEILPKSVITANKCLMHDSNERASASFIFPLRLSIVIPPKEYMELHCMILLWQSIVTPPSSFFFFFPPIYILEKVFNVSLLCHFELPNCYSSGMSLVDCARNTCASLNYAGTWRSSLPLFPCSGPSCLLKTSLIVDQSGMVLWSHFAVCVCRGQRWVNLFSLTGCSVVHRQDRLTSKGLQKLMFCFSPTRQGIGNAKEKRRKNRVK